jgi:hypothetical protein
MHEISPPFYTSDFEQFFYFGQSQCKRDGFLTTDKARAQAAGEAAFMAVIELELSRMG